MGFRALGSTPLQKNEESRGADGGEGSPPHHNRATEVQSLVGIPTLQPSFRGSQTDVVVR